MVRIYETRICKLAIIRNKYKLGVAFGAFDVLHTGHCLFLNAAKEHCENLYVGLQSDPTIDRPDSKNVPVQSMFERFVQLESLSAVDKVIPYQTEDEVIEILQSYPFDVRFLGTDYKGTTFTGCYLQLPIVYIDRRHKFSSSSIRNRILEAKK